MDGGGEEVNGKIMFIFAKIAVVEVTETINGALNKCVLNVKYLETVLHQQLRVRLCAFTLHVLLITTTFLTLELLGPWGESLFIDRRN